MDKIGRAIRKSNPEMWRVLDCYNTIEDFAYYVFSIRKHFSVKQIALLMGKSESWLYKKLESRTTGQQFTANEIAQLTQVTEYRWFINFLLKKTPFRVTRQRSAKEIIENFINTYRDDSTVLIR